ncbi:MAG: aquaporin, partial [Terriglobales bacterium]
MPTTAQEERASHWPEYLIEAAGLGVFMISACMFTALLQHPLSPVRQALPDPFLRNALTGLAMGLTLVGIVYSPWGKRSGAHLNPAFTLTFLRLGKVAPRDAAFYVGAQFVGGLAGVLLSAVLLGGLIRDPAVNFAVTVPGPAGAGTAFLAEVGISFLMMTIVLISTNAPGVARYTGLFAG